jgi:hypothetical protein
MPRLMANTSNQNVISMFTPSHQCSCAHVCVSNRIHKHTYVKQKSSTSNLGILNLASLWIFRRGVERRGAIYILNSFCMVTSQSTGGTLQELIYTWFLSLKPTIYEN